MKTILLILTLACTALAGPPASTATKPPVPKERAVTAVHYLQVASIYARTGAKPNVPENRTKVEALSDAELKGELARLLAAFSPASVPKDRRPEVLALYVGAVKKLSLDQTADHAELVRWAEANPDKFAQTVRKFEQMGRDAIK